MPNSPESITLMEAVKQRRSVRGFLDKEVPEDTLKAIFELAQQAPSNCNIQPWHVYVASGDVKNALREKMVQNVMQGVPFNSDYEYPDTFDGEYRKRQVDCAMELYGNMGIERGDKEEPPYRTTLLNGFHQCNRFGRIRHTAPPKNVRGHNT